LNATMLVMLPTITFCNLDEHRAFDQDASMRDCPLICLGEEGTAFRRRPCTWLQHALQFALFIGARLASAAVENSSGISLDAMQYIPFVPVRSI
jgi:hypothetical protein